MSTWEYYRSTREKWLRFFPLYFSQMEIVVFQVNNTIDDLLASIAPKAKVIVTGPSSSIIPDILFENKVNIIGATRITDSDLLFSIVGEAGAGFHLFKYCAQKISILNEQK